MNASSNLIFNLFMLQLVKKLINRRYTLNIYYAIGSAPLLITTEVYCCKRLQTFSYFGAGKLFHYKEITAEPCFIANSSGAYCSNHFCSHLMNPLIDSIICEWYVEKLKTGQLMSLL